MSEELAPYIGAVQALDYPEDRGSKLQKTSVTNYRSTRRHNPEDRKVNKQSCENLRSHKHGLLDYGIY
jgi:hypothetical protein